VAPICEGSTLSDLPLSSTNGIAGTWSPAINNMATTTYTFTPATGVCANTAPMTIIVNPKITPLFPSVPTLCYGDPGFSLPMMSNNGITGTWSPAFSNTQTSAYTFTPNVGECANTASLQIGVFSDFDFDYRKYCEKGDLMLQISPKLESFDLNTATFNWEQNGTTVGNSAIFNVTSYLNATAAVEVLPITFDITVTNANGCDKTKSIQINNVYCDIQKGISPNDDMLNDFFDLRLLDVKHLSIFNRYGVKVYSKSDYYDEWKGQSDSGSILPDGVYFYVIDFNTESSKTGWIYINKEH
jgi:gliding motility-associated-like protein